MAKPNNNNNTQPEVVRRKLIKWVNGVPLPVDSPILIDNKDMVKQIIAAAASLPYEDQDPLGLEPELFGHTKLEVAMIRLMRRAAHGDLDAIKIVLDRLMGRPEQLSKSLEVTGTYKDFLEILSKQDTKKEENGSETIIDTSALG